jgi:agmatine deiminase
LNLKIEHTPKSQGFFFPAEWHQHHATWFTFPYNEASWQGAKRDKMYENYVQLIKTISTKEKVCINANSADIEAFIIDLLSKNDIDLKQIEILVGPTNDAWCRDHGPSFLINPVTKQRMIVDWEYNAWGEKYPPFDSDNKIPQRIANYRNLPFVSPKIVMEGGSVEFNGAGTIMTSKSCLLNKNRNPNLNQNQIEHYLCEFYGAEQILWLDEGIVGDDTDGHIDDITRFINQDTVITMVEADKNDENHAVLAQNLNLLKKMRLLNGKQLNIVELQMPKPLVVDNFRVPASYGNFLICNAGVIVPTFKAATDQLALDIITSVVKDRPVIGLDSTDIIWGQGSFHCLSQQEPTI